MVGGLRSAASLTADPFWRAHERGRLDGKRILLQQGQPALEQAIQSVEQWVQEDRIAPKEAERRGAYGDGLRAVLMQIPQDTN